MSYGNQAIILRESKRLDDSMALFQKQEAIARKLDDQNSLQLSYGNQAVILRSWGRLEDAMVLHKKEETICLELGNQESLQESYGNQAIILRIWGRLDDAMALHKKQEAICLKIRNKIGLAHCYLEWGLLAREQKDSKTEQEKLRQALSLFTELKMPVEIKSTQNALNDTNNGSQPN